MHRHDNSQGRTLKSQLADLGWATTTADSKSELLGLAAELGRPVSSRIGGPIVQELQPTEPADAQTRSLSALHGTGAFPWHTDGAYFVSPPRFMLLRLATPQVCARPTFLLSIEDLQLSAAERAELQRAVYLVRRAGGGRFLTSILGTGDSSAGPAVRYDLGCMTPVREFEYSRPLMEAALTRSSGVAIEWAPCRVLVVDNWRCLHARGGTTSLAEHRLLERVLVS